MKETLINNNKENARLPSQLPDIIYEYLLEINEINGTSEFLENEGAWFVVGEILDSGTFDWGVASYTNWRREK